MALVELRSRLLGIIVVDRTAWDSLCRPGLSRTIQRIFSLVRWDAAAGVECSERVFLLETRWEANQYNGISNAHHISCIAHKS